MSAVLKTEEKGFSVSPFAKNPRLQVIDIETHIIDAFRAKALQWGVQAIEYKPFLRFAVADYLDELCDRQLGATLRDILNDRDRGAFMIQYEGCDQQEEDGGAFNVLFSTAISHLFGVPNLDAMYGKFYARFTVKNTDNSDSYLRQAQRRMELHNDGTYVDERTDFVLMMKMEESNMQGGDSLLLHVDDWADLDKFYNHPMAKQPILWGSPKSKNVDIQVEHPIFFEEDKNGKPHMLFIDQFAEPQNMQQGLYLYEMGESLESDENCFGVRVPVGSMLVVQNHCWLHGRDKFVSHPELSRELLRQRGHFPL